MLLLELANAHIAIRDLFPGLLDPFLPSIATAHHPLYSLLLVRLRRLLLLFVGPTFPLTRSPITIPPFVIEK